MKNFNLKTSIYFFVLALTASTLNAQDEELSDKYFQHVLFFKWNDTVNETKKEKILNLFKGLPPKVEGFEGVHRVNTILL